jgi:hypothetical protein
MKIVYVEWVDAFANSGWFNASKLKTCIENDNVWIKESGFVLRETKHHLILCTGWQIRGDYTEEQWCNVHKIPKTWIRKRKILMEVK